MCAYKVIHRSDLDQIAATGFIHECDLQTISAIVDKFFSDCSPSVVKLSIEQSIREGFLAKYELHHPDRTKFWHFYRPILNQLLSANCVKKVL